MSLKRAWGECLPPRIRVDLKESTAKALAQPQGGLRTGSRLGQPFPHQSPTLQRPWLQARAEPRKGIWKMASKGQVGFRRLICLHQWRGRKLPAPTRGLRRGRKWDKVLGKLRMTHLCRRTCWGMGGGSLRARRPVGLVASSRTLAWLAADSGSPFALGDRRHNHASLSELADVE